MIKANDGIVEIEGYTSTLLLELTGITASLGQKLPEDLIMIAVGMGLSHSKQSKKKSEDEELAEEFVEELMKRVKEKREAKDAQAD